LDYQRPTILLVEDDSATREMFEYALRLAGFFVVAVRDGFAGLRSIEQHHPDLVVLDLDLPHVSGMDVHREIMAHADTSRIPVVVVTGTNWQPPAGVLRTLRKPITSDVLVKIVEQALDEQGDGPKDGWRPPRPPR
jgi:DNA-binding response OmpR family regulator